VRGVLRVARAELFRLARLRSVRLTGLLLAAFSAASAWLSHASQRRDGALDAVSSGAGWASLVDGWRAGLVLGSFALLAGAARSIAGDRESGVLRLASTRSASRPALFVGRLLLSPPLVLATVLVTGLGAGISARALADFGPFVEDGNEIFAAGELAADLWTGVHAILPALLGTFAFGLLVSSLARGATVAVISALGLFVAFDLFKGALGDAGYWVFAAHAPSLVDSSAWSRLPGLARGYSDQGLSESLVRAAWIVPWPAIALCAALGCWVLARRAL